MGKAIRFGLAAATMLVILPAWGDGASVDDRQEAQRSQLLPGDTSASAPQQLSLAPAQDAQPQYAHPHADDGSGASEPGDERERDKRLEDKRLEQGDAAREQFLNEVWSKP
jgi:hypothetical protein